MKKLKVLLLALCIIGLFINFANASSSYYIENVHPVQFYVIDNDHDGEINLTIDNFFIPNNYDLQYSFNNSLWTTVDSDTVTIDTDKIENEKVNVYWRLYNKNIEGEGSEITYADLKFNGPFDDGGNVLWNSVYIYWNGGESGMTIETPGGNDKVAPVPISPSVLLLGIGLTVLLVFNRKEEV